VLVEQEVLLAGVLVEREVKLGLTIHSQLQPMVDKVDKALQPILHMV
jgi:hypothetical protein